MGLCLASLPQSVLSWGPREPPPTPQAWAVPCSFGGGPAPQSCLRSSGEHRACSGGAQRWSFPPLLMPRALPSPQMLEEQVVPLAGRTPPPRRWAYWLRTGQRGETSGSRPFSSPKPLPVPSASVGRYSLGVRRLQTHDIKCSCTETWPQSNYARKQEEPLRLIWLFRPGLPWQPRRDAQEGQLSGWAAVPHRVPQGGRRTDCPQD